MPEDFKPAKKLNRGDFDARATSDSISVIKWTDKRPVFIASNFEGQQLIVKSGKWWPITHNVTSLDLKTFRILIVTGHVRKHIQGREDLKNKGNINKCLLSNVVIKRSICLAH
ncbi:hypothetical protein CBL_10606 [Carabus blaptoides fortunei]